jgi:tRNA threonylcarbamoyladenosine biosynthesis protein TsaB
VRGATPRLGVALARLDARGVIDTFQLAGGEEGAGQHARRLPDLLLEVMAAADHSLDEIDALVVGLGPGSFTGLRTGLSTMNALAYGRKCPIVGVSSLAGLAADGAFALGASGREASSTLRLVPCFDARRAEVYAGCFDVQGTPQPPLDRVQAIDPMLLLKTLAAASSQEIHLFGSGGAAYADLEGSLFWRPELPTFPTGRGLIEIAASRLMRGDRDDPLTLLPHYARKAEAELKLQAGELKIQGLTVPSGPKRGPGEDPD